MTDHSATEDVVGDERMFAVAADALRPGPAPGIQREPAFGTAEATLIRARAEPRAASGWRPHGDRDLPGYVVRGRARVEFGAGGR